ncbi:hypothetical protein MKW98_027690 [Papaver atlanticum]|uniref:Uncharacterized protein n=1 Tax=Papaver atlanticum TaxID=357466 RepID=A0AAD4TC70_9MAGN|nr:hypothetical protein MKW98_027690 [Papaver atlanticum]
MAAPSYSIVLYFDEQLENDIYTLLSNSGLPRSQTPANQPRLEIYRGSSDPEKLFAIAKDFLFLHSLVPCPVTLPTLDLDPTPLPRASYNSKREPRVYFNVNPSNKLVKIYGLKPRDDDPTVRSTPFPWFLRCKFGGLEHGKSKSENDATYYKLRKVIEQSNLLPLEGHVKKVARLKESSSDPGSTTMLFSYPPDESGIFLPNEVIGSSNPTKLDVTLHTYSHVPLQQKRSISCSTFCRSSRDLLKGNKESALLFIHFSNSVIPKCHLLTEDHNAIVDYLYDADNEVEDMNTTLTREEQVSALKAVELLIDLLSDVKERFKTNSEKSDAFSKLLDDYKNFNVALPVLKEKMSNDILSDDWDLKRRFSFFSSSEILNKLHNLKAEDDGIEFVRKIGVENGTHCREMFMEMRRLCRNDEISLLDFYRGVSFLLGDNINLIIQFILQSTLRKKI